MSVINNPYYFLGVLKNDTYLQDLKMGRFSSIHNTSNQTVSSISRTTADHIYNASATAKATDNTRINLPIPRSAHTGNKDRKQQYTSKWHLLLIRTTLRYGNVLTAACAHQRCSATDYHHDPHHHGTKRGT
jgi:hypothetical protein